MDLQKERYGSYILFVFQTSESYLEILLEEYVQRKLTSSNLFINTSPKAVYDFNPNSFWKHSMKIQHIILLTGLFCAFSANKSSLQNKEHYFVQSILIH